MGTACKNAKSCCLRTKKLVFTHDYVIRKALVPNMTLCWMIRNKRMGYSKLVGLDVVNTVIPEMIFTEDILFYLTYEDGKKMGTEIGRDI